MKQILKDKTNLKDEFTERYDIDPDILLDPSHPEFNDKYCFSKDEEENILMAIKFRMGTRNTFIVGSFIGYHAVKTVMWRFGYGAHFFYKTRFMTIPIAIYALWYSSLHKFPADIKEAGIMEYYMKRNRFEKDSRFIRNLLQERLNYIEEHKKASQAEVNINKLINKQ